MVARRSQFEQSGILIDTIGMEAVFRALHDGGLVAIEGHVPGDVTLAVECDYLRERFPVEGNTFRIRLTRMELSLFVASPAY